MSLRFHEISEANHRILNPITEDKLMLLGEVCRLKAGMRQLDLCCGKGEMLCHWSRRWGIQGLGVDISPVFLAAAKARADEFEVSSRVRFVQQDASAFDAGGEKFDIVSCIGATWIGKGLAGTLALMKLLLEYDGLLLVGEPYWTETPPDEAFVAAEISRDDFTSLAGTNERIESAGFELVEMVLASPDSWDRYVASQWLTVSDWLRENPDEKNAAGLRDWIGNGRRTYLQFERRYLGWGIFVLRSRLG